jgi:LPXTG-site transpeptidase (sortase) family protein
MAFHLRATGRVKPLSVAGRRRSAAVAIFAGLAAFAVGLAILGAGLSPMFPIGEETATVAHIGSVPWANDPSGGLAASSRLADRLHTEVLPVIVDRPIDGVAFEMQIPALNYSAKVFEGVDTNTLQRGPGHYPGTAWPGRDGTVGIAAHNVDWLSFNRLKAGDLIQLRSPHGLFVYEITGSKVTDPGDVAVLRSTEQKRVTLTTCYPLWAGAFATKRLVFFARALGGVG